MQQWRIELSVENRKSEQKFTQTLAGHARVTSVNTDQKIGQTTLARLTIANSVISSYIMDSAAFGKAHVPGWEEGSGAYSLDTLGCFLVCEKALPDLLAALPSALAAVPVDRALVACDFGAADGGTSLPLWHSVADAVPEPRELHLLYEDQANNDWKSVFAHVDGRILLPMIPGCAMLSAPPLVPLSERPRVFVAAVGVSFHRQCLPSGSLHLGFSATAMHWLSRKPCDLPALHHTLCPRGCPSAEAFTIQGAHDWDRTLVARAKELAPGGRLIIAVFVVDDMGQCLGNTSASGGPSVAMYAALHASWLSLIDDGRITSEEAGRATFINYYRTPAQLAAPFAPGGAAERAGLRLLSSRIEVTPCVFRANWIANGGDATDYAKIFVKTVRTWSESTFSTALDATRGGIERKEIVNELYSRYAAVVAAAPADHGMDYVHSYLSIERVAI